MKDRNNKHCKQQELPKRLLTTINGLMLIDCIIPMQENGKID